jgi:predicted TIM-barrel fold metal-dependent hydrolase
MIVDAQIHIWGKDCPERPWPRAGANGRTARAQRDNPMTAAEAVSAMDAACVTRAILVPPSWEGERNDLVLAAAAAHPDRFAVMGRLPPDLRSLARWRHQPGMLGARIILGAETVDHWLWAEAQAQNVPLMIAPAGKVPLLARIAREYPALRLIIDHMGARVHETGATAFAQVEEVIAMAALPNVAIKATCLPGYSAAGHPWPDVTPYLRRLFDAFGAERTFWGSDLSRLPCPYPTLVRFFHEELPWLKGQARDLVMGGAILRWLDWNQHRSHPPTNGKGMASP